MQSSNEMIVDEVLSRISMHVSSFGRLSTNVR